MMMKIPTNQGLYLIKFKHYKSGGLLSVTGYISHRLNNNVSDKIIVSKLDGTYEDIIRESIVDIFPVDRVGTCIE